MHDGNFSRPPMKRFGGEKRNVYNRCILRYYTCRAQTIVGENFWPPNRSSFGDVCEEGEGNGGKYIACGRAINRSCTLYTIVV